MHGVFGNVSTIGTVVTAPETATRQQQITGRGSAASLMRARGVPSLGFVRYQVFFYPHGMSFPAVVRPPFYDGGSARSWAERLVCTELPQQNRVIVAGGDRADGSSVILGHWGANGTTWVGADYPWSDIQVMCPRYHPGIGQAAPTGGCPPGQIGIPPLCIPTGAPGTTPAPAPGVPALPGIPGQMPVTQKTVSGFTYRLADPSLVNQVSGSLFVASQEVAEGFQHKGIRLPKTTATLTTQNTGVTLGQWGAEQMGKGNAVVLTGPEVSPAAKALAIATRSVKLAADINAADPLSMVLSEPQEGWLMPNEVTATGEAKPPYLLYAAIGGAALLLVALVASRD